VSFFGFRSGVDGYTFFWNMAPRSWEFGFRSFETSTLSRNTGRKYPVTACRIPEE